MIPKPAVKPPQKCVHASRLLSCWVTISIPKVGNFYLTFSFSLIASQVSASLDALTDVTDGKVNIHVLIMALACFASVFMGNTLEGGLLFAMFNLAHIGHHFEVSPEDYFPSDE
jgi:hypothetical protein